MKDIKKMKSKQQIGRKYFQITYLTKELYPEYVKNSQNNKKTNQFKNRQNIWTNISPSKKMLNVTREN